MTEWELVMPFLVTESEGGLYDDLAYVAGFECGQIDGLLAALIDNENPQVETVTRIVRAANVTQVDLVAMRRGFTAEVGEVEQPDVDAIGGEEWATVTLRRVR